MRRPTYWFRILMIVPKLVRTTLALAAAFGASACGPTSDCKCAGRDVNASIWGTEDGTLLVTGYTGLDRGFVKRSTALGFALDESFELPLWRGWGTSAADYFAVGGPTGSKSVVHRTGGTVKVWGAAGSSAPVTSAWGIWGAAPDSVFVVGKGGTIAHFDGNTWTAHASPVSEDLHDVWGTAADDVFAVGNKGAAVHFDGSVWTQLESQTVANLNAVWGSSAEDVFIVGETKAEQSHVILHYDGASFELVHEGDHGLLGVHGVAGDRVVAVGGKRVAEGVDAQILKFDGVEWTAVPTSAGTFLWDVWVDADGSGYTVVGPQDTLQRLEF